MDADSYRGIDLVAITNGILEQLDYKYHNCLATPHPFKKEKTLINEEMLATRRGAYPSAEASKGLDFPLGDKIDNWL